MIFNIFAFILWILSLIMIFVDYHWGWLLAFSLTTIYFMLCLGSGGFIDIDIDL